MYDTICYSFIRGKLSLVRKQDRRILVSLVDLMQSNKFNGNFQVSGGSTSLGGHGIVTSANKEMLAHAARSCSKIPQLDGPIPETYDDVISTPNVSMVLL